jgi:hypothetical protein
MQKKQSYFFEIFRTDIISIRRDHNCEPSKLESVGNDELSNQKMFWAKKKFHQINRDDIQGQFFLPSRITFQKYPATI